MSDWSYLPVTIHFANPTLVNATSGVYIYNASTGEYYFLTITSVPDPESYSYSFTTGDLIKSSTIDWLPLILESSLPINRVSDYNDLGFSNFIEDRIYNDAFEFAPGAVEDLKVLMFGLAFPLAEFNSIINLSSMVPFVPTPVKSVRVPSKFVISCCPFSLTNVAVFIDYKVRGSLNYKFENAGFFTDCRYLDNMIGGIVNLDASLKVEQSLGLIAGSLKKRNGDGNLMAIISWDAILGAIDFSLFGNYRTGLKTPISSSPASSRKGPISESVVRISVETHDDESFWGSGVVISDRYIITNEHVMKLDRLKTFTISISGRPHLKITDKDATVIKSPMKGYDLCFIRIHSDPGNLKPAKRCSSYASQYKTLCPGTYVQSLGYGLFYLKNQQEMLPMHSEGYINRLVPLDIGLGRPELALIIASAGCWNGSSGGGIFNSDGELVGIMTSNGKLSSGEIIPEFTLVIPITVIERCIFMMQNNRTMDISERIKDLWYLRNTHTSNMIVPSSTKNSKL